MNFRNYPSNPPRHRLTAPALCVLISYLQTNSKPLTVVFFSNHTVRERERGMAVGRKKGWDWLGKREACQHKFLQNEEALDLHLHVNQFAFVYQRRSAHGANMKHIQVPSMRGSHHCIYRPCQYATPTSLPVNAHFICINTSSSQDHWYTFGPWRGPHQWILNMSISLL